MMSTSIIDFWFAPETKAQWFIQDNDFDDLVFSKYYSFLRIHERITWEDTPESFLGNIIMLDQFSRSMFRGSIKAIEHDPLAMSAAVTAISRGYHLGLTREEAVFMLMPLMHNERMLSQEQSVLLYTELGHTVALKEAKRNYEIISRFNRFPHLNNLIGRRSTVDELDFLLNEHQEF